MAEIRKRRDDAGQARRKSRKAPTFAPAGQSTQMVVGAGDSTDQAILDTASTLYARHRLKRIYYSAYSPIPGADPRLPATAPPLGREHRLYQADWLIRVYGFDATELTSPEEPDLPLDVDPKTAWALRHREFFPVDVNRAPREALLRVPGLGTRNTRRVLAIRRHHQLELADLARLRVVLKRALPFIVAADHHPDPALLDHPRLRQRLSGDAPAEQLDLFQPKIVPPTTVHGSTWHSAQAAVTGEL